MADDGTGVEMPSTKVTFCCTFWWGGGLTWGFFCRTLSSGNGEYWTILTDNKLKKTRLSKTEAVFLCFAFLSFQCRRVNFQNRAERNLKYPSIQCSSQWELLQSTALEISFVGHNKQFFKKKCICSSPTSSVKKYYFEKLVLVLHIRNNVTL